MNVFRTGLSTVITMNTSAIPTLSPAAAYYSHSQIPIQAFATSENPICLLFNIIATHQLNIILSSFSVTSTEQLINVMYDQLYWSYVH